MVKLGLLGLAVMVSGACVGSVNPIYTKADVAFDSTLLGTWGDSASSAQVTLTRAGPAEYDLVSTDDHGKHAHFSGHLTHFRGVTAMDLAPAALPDTLSEDYRSMFVSLHVFLFVDPRRDRLRYVALDMSELKLYLKANPRAIAHVIADSAHGGDPLLTASPEALQAFLPQYLRRPKALGDTMVLLRRTGGH